MASIAQSRLARISRPADCLRTRAQTFRASSLNQSGARSETFVLRFIPSPAFWRDSTSAAVQCFPPDFLPTAICSAETGLVGIMKKWVNGFDRGHFLTCDYGRL